MNKQQEIMEGLREEINDGLTTEEGRHVLAWITEEGIKNVWKYLQDKGMV